MRQLDLFSGIGGFALAARWMGWTTVQFVEIDPFCQKVLSKNFSDTPIHGDIKTFDGKSFRGSVDILTGGFPCQPFSTAGKRKGVEDDRYLWPEMLRVIREVQPTFIVGENVYGLVNWSKGLVFEKVCSDLENEGYEVTPIILPACGVNAPHRRDRIWFVAHSEGAGNSRDAGKLPRADEQQEGQRPEEWIRQSKYAVERLTSNAHSYGDSQKLAVGENPRGARGNKEAKKRDVRACENGQWLRIDSYGSDSKITANPGDLGRQRGNERLQEAQEPRLNAPSSHERKLRTDWERNDLPAPTLARVDDGIPHLVDRVKGYGNAIVPQVAFEIFKAIEATML